MSARRTPLLALAVALLGPMLALGTGTLAAPPVAGAPVVDDPLIAHQWGLSQIKARQAWATTRGAGVVIAIVDSGVDRGHPDLAGKLLPGATFLDCGTESCGDGGWHSGPAARRDSASPHGTHVAGIAAAATGNGIGIAGVAPDAKVLPVKVVDSEGASLSDVARGVRWAVDHGARVVNLSLGAAPGVQLLGGLGAGKELKDALAHATSRNVVVTAAAGNETFPLCSSPAFDPGAMCVAATDRRGLHSLYSNLPVRPDLAAVSAPGGSSLPLCNEDIVSSVSRGTGTSVLCGLSKDYDALAGTSMAAPHVAGVAALLAAQGRSRANIVRALTTTARQPLVGLRGSYNPVYGYGIVDAAAAVASPR